jgi:hypothetical protein
MITPRIEEFRPVQAAAQPPQDAPVAEPLQAVAPAPDELLKRVYWLVTALALSAHLGGWESGLGLAIAVTALQALHFALKRRSATVLVVQVRAAYLVLLLAGLLPAFSWIPPALLAGVAALLAFDYFLLARLLALAPWNRTAPLSWQLVRRVMLTPPAPSSILERLPAARGGTARRDSRR